MKTHITSYLTTGLSALLLLALCSCSGIRLRPTTLSVRPLDNQNHFNAKEASRVYFLPRSRVDFEINFMVLREKFFKKSEVKEEADKRFEGGESDRFYLVFAEDANALSINSNIEPDPLLAFEIPVEKIGGAFTNIKKLSVQTDSSGMLTSVSGEFEDKTVETIEKLVDLGIDVAKFASGVSVSLEADRGPDYAELERLTGYDRRISKSVLLTSFKQTADGNLEIDLQSEFDDLKKGLEKRLKMDRVHGAAFQRSEFQNSGVTGVAVRIKSETPIVPKKTADELLKGHLVTGKKNYFPGIIHRRSSPVEMEILADLVQDTNTKRNEVVMRTVKPIPEAGTFGWIPVKAKILADNKTTLTFDATSHELTNWEVVQSSQAFDLATALESNVEKGLKASQSIEKQRADNEAARQTAAQEKINQQLSLQQMEVTILTQKNTIAQTSALIKNTTTSIRDGEQQLQAARNAGDQAKVAQLTQSLADLRSTLLQNQGKLQLEELKLKQLETQKEFLKKGFTVQ